MYPSQPLSTEQRADLHVRARRQALHLRDDAVAAFWFGVYQHTAGALRAAQRLLHHTVASTVSHKPSGV